MRISLLVFAASAVLAACGPKSPPPSQVAVVPPPPPPMQVQPVSAKGTEQAWGAEIVDGAMVVTRPGEPTLRIYVTPTTPDGTLAWVGEGNSLVITKTACTDGKSDIAYPMTASLSLGGDAMKGCADFKSDKPAELAAVAKPQPAQP